MNSSTINRRQKNTLSELKKIIAPTFACISCKDSPCGTCEGNNFLKVFSELENLTIIRFDEFGTIIFSTNDTLSEGDSVFTFLDKKSSEDLRNAFLLTKDSNIILRFMTPSGAIYIDGIVVKQKSPKEYIIFGYDLTELKNSKNKLKKHKELTSTILNTQQNMIFLIDFSKSDDHPDHIKLMNTAVLEFFGVTTYKELKKDIKLSISEKFVEYNNSEYVSQNRKAWRNYCLYEFKKEQKKVALRNKLGQEIKFKAQISKIGARLVVVTLVNFTEVEEQISTLHEMNRAKSKFLANMSHEIRTPMNAILGFVEILFKQEENSIKKEYLDIINKNGKLLLDIINEILDFSKIENGELEIFETAFKTSELQSIIGLFSLKALEKGIELNFFISPDVPQEIKQDQLRLKQVINNLVSNAIKFTNAGGSVNVDIRYFNEDDKDFLLITVADSGIGIPENKMDVIFDPYKQAELNTNYTYGGTGLGLNICKNIVEKLKGNISVSSKENVGSTFEVKIPIVITKTKEEQFDLSNMNVHIVRENFSEKQLSILVDYLKSFRIKNITFDDSLHKEQIDMMNDVVVFLSDSPMNLMKLRKMEKNIFVVVKKQVDHDFNSIFKHKENVFELSMPILASKLLDLLYSILYEKETEMCQPTEITFFGNVLVVEDNPSNRLLIELFLKKFKNLNISFAQNGLEGLEYFKNNFKNLDIILMDEHMPILNGSEALIKIRHFEEENQLKHIPVVALTANATMDERRRLLELTFDEFLPKPISAVSLTEILKKHLKYKLEDEITGEINKINKALISEAETLLDTIRFGIKDPEHNHLIESIIKLKNLIIIVSEETHSTLLELEKAINNGDKKEKLIHIYNMLVKQIKKLGK